MHHLLFREMHLPPLRRHIPIPLKLRHAPSFVQGNAPDAAPAAGLYSPRLLFKETHPRAEFPRVCIPRFAPSFASVNSVRRACAGRRLCSLCAVFCARKSYRGQSARDGFEDMANAQRYRVAVLRYRTTVGNEPLSTSRMPTFCWSQSVQLSKH